jgi:hypothetical protein
LCSSSRSWRCILRTRRSCSVHPHAPALRSIEVGCAAAFKKTAALFAKFRGYACFCEIFAKLRPRPAAFSRARRGSSTPCCGLIGHLVKGPPPHKAARWFCASISDVVPRRGAARALPPSCSGEWGRTRDGQQQAHADARRTACCLLLPPARLNQPPARPGSV